MAVDDLFALVTRTHSYAELSRAQLENVLDMLDGRYPSSEFAELRPRIVWDRVAGTIRPRRGARQLAVTNAGTIPDRGLFAVTLPDGRRVGELDEEMIYEARPGQTFLLGATTWRIEEIRMREAQIETTVVPRIRRATTAHSSRSERNLGSAPAADVTDRVAGTPDPARATDLGDSTWMTRSTAPMSVARGLQRIGRAGHSVGDVSRGRIFPKFRSDLLECAVVARRMREAQIETTVVPRNPLDVLAQQIVAIAAAAGEDESVAVDDLFALVTRTHSYAELSRGQFENVLDMLDGRYPSSEFAELRPRIVWDRVAGTIPAAPRRPPACRHQRRHYPVPRPVRGHAA